MGRKYKAEISQQPEVFITRQLLYPEQLEVSLETIARGLGSGAILLDASELTIPLFKASALPNFKNIKNKQALDDFVGELEAAVSHKEPEVIVPVYKNSLPTLFTVSGTSDLGIRLRNNYPKELFAENEDIVPETVQDQFAGGQVDFMVHTAVEVVRTLFHENPVGPDHRGYIKGRDARMRNHEIHDYLKAGTIIEEHYFDDFEGLRIVQQNPEFYIREQGIELFFPEELAFGAMQVVVRARKQELIIVN